MTIDTKQTIAEFLESIKFSTFPCQKGSSLNADVTTRDESAVFWMLAVEIPQRTDNATEWVDDANHWRLTFESEAGRSMIIDYSQGSAHATKGKRPPYKMIANVPDVADVLSCLASDSMGVENTRCFEDWAGEYGCDTDSRKAERTYKTCQDQSAELARFLGEDNYRTLLYETEPE